jgi:prepilin-type N-terminal cleavage/methylation domain-containing protein
MRRTRRTQGFSLVELSIVLVILGLLVGGILSGQALIRASELRSITTEYQRYTTAVGTFRDKYFALPGDMSNASSFWSGVGDGDGDGLIENNGTAADNEISLFWIHAANAQLIEGNFTNVAGTTMTSGTNNPRAKMSSAAWNVAHIGTVSVAGVSSPVAGATDPAAGTFFAGTYGNVLVYGSGTNALLPGGVLKAEEAWNIDTKMDDARPDLGSVTTLESQGADPVTASSCSNQDGATTALAASAYALTSTSRTACSLVLKTGY